MTTVNGIASAASTLFAPQAAPGAMTVAAALSTLKARPGASVDIVDTVANIQKNLDALQGLAARITSLETGDTARQLQVGAGSYQRNAAILAKWGAGDGQTVEVANVGAAAATALVAAKPAWVTSITVADGSGNLQRNLDALQALVTGGNLRQIVHTGPATPMKITAAQLVANQDALGAIKNQAYALAITDATVSHTLGLDGQSALGSNPKIKSIAVKDGTDAIEANLDALQRVGLKLKSISQTDADNPLTLTGAQYWQNAVAIGKILTNVQLDVIRASAAQTAQLAANQKVVTISVADTAANIARRWGLMDRLADSLTAIEVTDAGNPVTITGDQLSAGSELLAKFAGSGSPPYQLAVTGVKAGQAATVAAIENVSSVKVADTAANIVAHLDALHGVGEAGLLQGIGLTGKNLTLTVGAGRLLGDPLAATQAVLGKIGNGAWRLAVTDVDLADLDTISAHARVVAMDVKGSGDEIASRLDTLFQLGKKLTRIQQTDSGGAIDVTQAAFETRSSVLAKIDGGYTVNVSGVSAAKALATAMNSHVATLAVADTGKSLAAHWGGLRSLGAALSGVSKTDEGSLSLTASAYLSGVNDGLVAKFGAEQAFALRNASVAQALQLAEDDAVDRIDITDDGSAVAEQMAELSTLQGGGKLQQITLNAGATGIALQAGELAAAQDVLGLIQGGRYSLAVDEVDVADAAALLAANPKIARMKVQGSAAGIVEHLADLTAAGHKLVSLVQTDAAEAVLSLTGNAFDQNRSTLAKIVGGYQADLTEVAAAKAATLAGSLRVRSLQVQDTGANLAATWGQLGTLGNKLADITQTDDAALQLKMSQWTSGQGLVGKFASPLAVSVSGAGVADIATLSADDAVQAFQLADIADALSAAWDSLAGETKLTQIRITDPATALAMSAETLAASTDRLALITDGNYRLALGGVAVADAAMLAADTHVASMEVTGSGEEIAAAFDTLAGLSTLQSLTLSDDNGTLSLTAAQVLGGSATLGRITNPYQIAATGAALADLEALQALNEVSTIALSDSTANVAAAFDDLLAMGSQLASLSFTDDTPVLALTQAAWTDGATVLAKVDGAYQADLSAVAAGSVDTLAAEATVRQLSVADTADALATQWATLVAAWDGGNGKLAAVQLSDDNPLSLTEAQQADGAAMIAALLPDETIVTVG